MNPLIFIAVFTTIIHQASCWDYCGSQRFSPAFSLCCFGRVVKQTGLRSACCGFQAYNQIWQQCCNGVILKKSIINTQCCGYQQYDPRWKKCCYGNLIPSSATCHNIGYGFQNMAILPYPNSQIGNNPGYHNQVFGKIVGKRTEFKNQK